MCKVLSYASHVVGISVERVLLLHPSHVRSYDETHLMLLREGNALDRKFKMQTYKT